MTTDPTARWLRLVGRIAAPAVGCSAYLYILLHWTAGSGSTITQSWSAGLIAVGSLAGLTGAFLALTQLLLQSRMPLLEAPFGRAALVRFHRANGYAVILALYTHATLVVYGYSLANHVSPIRQDINFITSFPYVIWSSTALVLLTVVVGLSITIVRRRLRYETWYFVHLLTYVAISIAFFHQLAVGIDFTAPSSAHFRLFWYVIYIVVFGSIVVFRVGRPLYRLWRFRFQVDRIVTEADGIHSVYVTGRGLAKLRFVPGQFMIWRFLDSGRWWQAHPFTISAGPNSEFLRLTAKAVGDFTRDLASVKPGTPVVLDGPYGTFTLQDETSNQLLLIAGGIGLTPLRAMLEAVTSQNVVLLYSVRRVADIALQSELTNLAASHDITIKYIVSDEQVAGYEYGRLDAATMKRLAPDVGCRVVYLCGPPPMMSGVSATLIGLGVAETDIHTERFAF